MGDNIIDDGNLVITVAGESAGDEAGQLILSDITLSSERDNTNYHGLGNRDTQAIGFGNKEHTLSFEGIVEETIADVIVDMYENDETVQDADIIADGALAAEIGVVVWNSVETGASDGDDVTLSVEADCRDVDLRRDN